MAVVVSVQLLKEFPDLVSRQRAAHLTEEVTEFRGADVAVTVHIWSRWGEARGAR